MKTKPFLKWAGGKRQLMNYIVDLLPSDYRESLHVEPFIGGGSVLLSLQPKKAIINDFNIDLINLWRCIKDNLDQVYSYTCSLKNTKEDFYKNRLRFNSIDVIGNEIEKAALFLYINKTGFNGLCRYGPNGINTPWGHNPKEDMSKLIDYDNLKAVSKYLNDNNIEILEGPYSYVSLEDSDKKVFWYLDPPYAPLDGRSNFVEYSKSSGWENIEQVKLRDFCKDIDKKGQKFILSNSDCTLIRDLYKEFNVNIVPASRRISSSVEGRAQVNEVIVTNY